MCTYAATRPDYVATCGMFVCCLETHEQRGRHGHAGTAAKITVLEIPMMSLHSVDNTRPNLVARKSKFSRSKNSDFSLVVSVHTEKVNVNLCRLH